VARSDVVSGRLALMSPVSIIMRDGLMRETPI